MADPRSPVFCRPSMSISVGLVGAFGGPCRRLTTYYPERQFGALRPEGDEVCGLDQGGRREQRTAKMCVVFVC